MPAQRAARRRAPTTSTGSSSPSAASSAICSPRRRWPSGRCGGDAVEASCERLLAAVLSVPPRPHPRRLAAASPRNGCPAPPMPPAAADAGRRSANAAGGGRPRHGPEPEPADGPGRRVARPGPLAPAVLDVAAAAQEAAGPPRRRCSTRCTRPLPPGGRRDRARRPCRPRPAGRPAAAGRCSPTACGEFEDHAGQAEDLNSRLHHEVIASRMRPLADGVRGFPRLVRDTGPAARQAGPVRGRRRDDRGRPRHPRKLEAPLNHLIRNALDHGIEPPERAGRGRQAGGGHDPRWRPATAPGCSRSPSRDDGRGHRPGPAPRARSSSAAWPPPRWPRS